MKKTAAGYWKSIVGQLLTGEMLAELLSKLSPFVNTTSSLFSTKDQELLARSHAWKRLSFALFLLPKDHFFPQLPLLQEKCVEAFKSSFPELHAQAFFFLRILLLRMSSQKLHPFWPFILSEMISCFSQLLRKESSHLSTLLSACKFLDIALLLDIEEIQWHRWIFVTESFELLQGIESSSYQPTALLDRIVKENTQIAQESKKQSSYTIPYSNSLQTSLAKPLFTMKQIDSLDQLLPFLQHLSLHTYTSVSDSLDIELVETLILNEFLSE
jgi:hypothetical protein